MRPGPDRTTVYEIAARAEVSIATVSRVLNNAPNVRQATRDRVLAAMAELAYVPNALAQGMGRGETKVIGLVYQRHPWTGPEEARAAPDSHAALIRRSRDSLTYYDLLIRGVEVAAHANGYAVLLSGARTDNEIDLVLSLSGRCDGLILMGRVVPASEIQRITRRVRVASIANFIDDPAVTNVSVDNERPMQAIVDHLATIHAVRRIAYLGGPSSDIDAVQRERAVVDRAAHHGIALEPLETWRGNFLPHTAYDIVRRQWPALTARPDAIVCGNDASAFGAMAALNDLNARVPADVIVTGFDDAELARLTTPALTTAHQSLSQIARIAVDALCATPSTLPATYAVDAPLVVRQSCGCRPGGERLFASSPHDPFSLMPKEAHS